MKQHASRPHDEAVVEPLREDPQFAEAYPSAAPAGADEPGGPAAKPGDWWLSRGPNEGGDYVGLWARRPLARDPSSNGCHVLTTDIRYVKLRVSTVYTRKRRPCVTPPSICELCPSSGI